MNEYMYISVIQNPTDNVQIYRPTNLFQAFISQLWETCLVKSKMVAMVNFIFKKNSSYIDNWIRSFPSMQRVCKILHRMSIITHWCIVGLWNPISKWRHDASCKTSPNYAKISVSDGHCTSHSSKTGSGTYLFFFIYLIRIFQRITYPNLKKS